MSGDELKKLQGLLDPRTPAPQQTPITHVVAGLQALNAAEKVIDAAKETSPAEKTFRTLQARVALIGMQLVRTDPADGPQRFFLVKGAKAVELCTVDDLESLLGHLRDR